MALLLLAMAAPLAGGDSAPTPTPKPPASDPEVAVISREAVRAVDRRIQTAEAKIREALRARLLLDLKSEPLHQVLATVAKQTAISIRISANDLAEEGIDRSEPITFQSGGATLGQSLSRILEPLGLTWLIERESLIVTTLIRADEHMSARTHNVGRLLRAIEADLDPARVDPNAQSAFAGAVAGIGAFGPEADAFRRQERAKAAAAFDAAEANQLPTNAARVLMDALQLCTEGPWRDGNGAGGTLSIAGDVMVVRQTAKAHDEVAGVLAVLEGFVAGRSKTRVLRHFPDWSPADDDEEIRKGLREKLPDVDLVDTPLREVVDYFAELLDVRIWLDETSLMEEGIATDEPIHFSGAGLEAESALRLILRPLELTLLVEDGCLVIMTETKSNERLHVELYDVRDLLEYDGIDRQTLSECIESGTVGPWAASDGSFSELMQPLRGALLIRQTQEVHEQVATLLADLREKLAVDGKKSRLPSPADPEKIELRFYPLKRQNIAADLRETIQAVISPKTWNTKDGTGRIETIGDTLAIRQSCGVHQQIRQLLKSLEAAESNSQR